MANQSNQTPKLVTESEQAELLGLSVHTLRKDRQTKRLIPYFQIGGSIRYNPEETLKALDAFKLGGA